MNNLTELDKRIKELFFQLLATGNRYVSYVNPGHVCYKLIDDSTSTYNDDGVKVGGKEVCWELSYYKYKIDIENEIKGMHSANISELHYFAICESKQNNDMWTFTLSRGCNMYVVKGLSLHEYADACTILDNIIKEHNLNELNQLDRLTDEMEVNEL